MSVLEHFWGRRPNEKQLKARMRRTIQALIPGLTPDRRRGRSRRGKSTRV